MLLVTSQFTHQQERIQEIAPELLEEFRPLIAAIAKCPSLCNWPFTLPQKQAMYPGIPEAHLKGFDHFVSTPLYEEGAYIRAIRVVTVVENLY